MSFHGATVNSSLVHIYASNFPKQTCSVSNCPSYPIPYSVTLAGFNVSGNVGSNVTLYSVYFPTVPPDLDAITFAAPGYSSPFLIFAATGMYVGSNEPPSEPPVDPPVDLAPNETPANAPADPPVDPAPSDPPPSAPVDPPVDLTPVEAGPSIQQPASAPSFLVPPTTAATEPVGPPTFTPAQNSPQSPQSPPQSPPTTVQQPYAPTSTSTPVPVAAPADSCGIRPYVPPGGNLICNGTWIIVGNVTFPTTGVVFNTTGGVLPTTVVSGCVQIGPDTSAVVFLDPTAVTSLIALRNVTYNLVQSQLGCLSGNFSTLRFECTERAQCESNCVSANQRQTTTLLSVVFSSGCNTNVDGPVPSSSYGWIIAVAVLGFVALLVLVIFIIAKKNRKFREKIFPFLDRRREALATPREVE